MRVPYRYCALMLPGDQIEFSKPALI